MVLLKLQLVSVVGLFTYWNCVVQCMAANAQRKIDVSPSTQRKIETLPTTEKTNQTRAAKTAPHTKPQRSIGKLTTPAVRPTTKYTTTKKPSPTIRTTQPPVQEFPLEEIFFVGRQTSKAFFLNTYRSGKWIKTTNNITATVRVHRPITLRLNQRFEFISQ